LICRPPPERRGAEPGRKLILVIKLTQCYLYIISRTVFKVKRIQPIHASFLHFLQLLHQNGAPRNQDAPFFQCVAKAKNSPARSAGGAALHVLLGRQIFLFAGQKLIVQQLALHLLEADAGHGVGKALAGDALDRKSVV